MASITVRAEPVTVQSFPPWLEATVEDRSEDSKSEGSEAGSLSGRWLSTLADGIADVRDAVCALMRTRRREFRKKKQMLVQVQCSIVGTAWCAVSDKYLVTARHVLNDGKEPEGGRSVLRLGRAR